MRRVQAEIDAFNGDALVPTYKWAEGTSDEPLVAPEISPALAVRAFTVADPQHRCNLAIADGNTLSKITNEGGEQLAKIAMGERRIVHWSNPEGIALEGIVTFPADYSPGQRFPFMVLPHGGPESNDVFSLSPFTRIFSGMGYVVLQPEYRGSTGYGTDFMSAIYQHFGDRAYRDVDSATDFAIAQGWADPKRLTIFGWSAGGFMTS
jgi:dipeptidyl aminopeptidase/acylaminoacyl peptidase